MNSIEVRDVTKAYGDVRALDGVSLSFSGDKIYGLLGRNGAGKTTLLNAITNRIFIDNGNITVNGEPAQENDRALSQVYLMSEKASYPDSMRVQDVFRWTSAFHAGAFDMAYALKLCEAFGLNPQKKVKQLSTGYASIYKIITALSLKVPFLLLDEPVLGLDANHRELLYRTILENYADMPRTIVISTHLIEEVSNLIEEVVIIKEGRIIKQASSETLLSGGYTVSGPAEIVNAYVQGRELIGADTLGGLKTAYVMGKPDRDALPSQLEITGLDLQRLFIQLTNN